MNKLMTVALILALLALAAGCGGGGAPTTTAPTAATAASTGTTGGLDNSPKVLTLTLKQGIKWSDGTPFNSKDVVGTYNILWAEDDSTWAALSDVVARDDNTIDFMV